MIKYRIGKRSGGYFIYKRKVLNIVSVLLLISGVYLLLLIRSPVMNVGAGIINSKVEAEIPVSVNTLKIPKIGVSTPYYSGDQSVLEKGAWHRYPDKGNPSIGGNFILSAHRFNLGLTPQRTKAKSPFYKIDKLEIGDDIYVSYGGKDYHYKVDRVYDVSRSAVEIEAPSKEAKLTLYSCSLLGEKNGRVVIEAKPA